MLAAAHILVSEFRVNFQRVYDKKNSTDTGFSLNSLQLEKSPR
jgi:hypothetical protein